MLWDGQDLAGVPAYRRSFGLMFQDYALFPHRNVAENVAFGLRMRRHPEAGDRPARARGPGPGQPGRRLPTGGSPTFPAGSSSAWRWRAPWRRTRAC